MARIISGRASLGVSRQIFYVQLGSFDTHNNQAQIHSQLLTQLGAALEYFDGLMINMGLSNHVTAFTISDFGRTLTCNATAPTTVGEAIILFWAVRCRGRTCTANIQWSASIRPTTSAQAG